MLQLSLLESSVIAHGVAEGMLMICLARFFCASQLADVLDATLCLVSVFGDFVLVIVMCV